MKKPDVIPTGEINPKSIRVLGADIARQGSDETAIVILEKLPFSDDIFITYMETLHTPDLREAIGRIIYLNKFFNCKKIYIDETGLGSGVSDVVKGEVNCPVEGVWYTQKMKAEMFNNLLILMKRPNNKLYIPSYLENTNPIVKKMYYQFLSMKREFKDGDATRNPKIYHDSRSHDDIVNAIALACLHFNVRGKSKKSYVLGGFNYS